MISSSSIFASPPVSRRRCYQWFRSPRDKPFILVSLGRPSTSKLTLALLSCNSSSPKQIAHAVQRPSASNLAEEDNDDEEGFQVVTAVRTNYNDIVIIDTRDSRMLLLDSSHNVHSIFNKGEKWTGAYWDEFASLPAVVPQGPIAILGLGGGTAAHLMLDLWPSLQLEGWEIDEILIYKAREYLGLSDLEKHTSVGGILCVHIGDAFSPLVNIPGGYAGIVIDLFSNGKVLPQLEEVATWLELSEKLMPHGRLMVNCGAANEGTSVADGTWIQNSTIKALCQAFPGQVNWKKLTKAEGENFLALTGPLPDLTAWSAVLPDRLSSAVKQWAPCLPV
ncbi:Spermidine synthase [Bertholletia excelsa]